MDDNEEDGAFDAAAVKAIVSKVRRRAAPTPVPAVWVRRLKRQRS